MTRENPLVILVGTHVDKLTKTQKKELSEVESAITTKFKGSNTF
jgi:hypothetical protein